MSPGGERPCPTDLLELLDDLLVFAQVGLVSGVHPCRGWERRDALAGYAPTPPPWRRSGEEEQNLPGLESSVFRLFSFLTFICLAISPEEHTHTRN